MPFIAILAVAMGGLFGDAKPAAPAHLAPLLVEGGDFEAGPQPWARPLAGGPIEALVVAPRFALLDVAALARTLDLDLTIVPLWSSGAIGYEAAHPDLALPGAAEADVLEDLGEALHRGPGLIVLARFDLSILPDETVRAIIEALRGGAGLVLAGVAEPLPDALGEALAEAQRDEDADAQLGAAFSRLFEPDGEMVDLLWTARHESGRIAELSYGLAGARYGALTPAFVDPAFRTGAFLEGYLGALAHVFRWAAGREPEAVIADIALPPPPEEEDAPPPGEIPGEFIERMRDWSANPGSQDLRVAVEGVRGNTYGVRVRVRGPQEHRAWVYDFGRAAWEQEGQGPSYFPVSLPMGAGSWFVDAWLVDRKGRVVDWYGERMEIPGWPRFEQVSFSKLAAAPHDALTVTVAVPPFLAHMKGAASGLSRIQRNGAIRADARDPHGRLVAEAHQRISAGGGAVNLTLAWAGLLANSVTVDIYAAVSNQTPLPEQALRQAAHVRQVIPIRQPPRPQLEAVAFMEGGVEPLLTEVWPALRETGVRLISCPSAPDWADELTRAGFIAAPRLTAYQPEAVAADNARQPCLSNPAYRLAELQSLRDMAPPFIEAGAPVLSLGHDNRLGPPGAPVCQSGYCLERFRRWLEDSYGGLDALNRAWGGRLTHWSQAQPFTLEKARETGVYAPWLDFRRSMDRVFAGIHADGRSTLTALDATASAGISAASLGGLYSGRDWTMLAQRLPFLAVPPDPVVMARLRSHGMAGAVHGVFAEAGEEGAVERAAWLPWRAALDGFSQVWRYPALARAESPAIGSMLDPWGRPTPATAALAGALSQANAGAGPLILRATPAPSRLAILDARENHYLDALLDTPGATDAAEAGFLRLAAGLGYAPEFLTPARLAETGGLPYRCVILPNARALSNAAVLALRSFSEAGGLLVADTPPADYDQHGAPRDGSALASAFGLDDLPEGTDAEQPAARFTPATDKRGPALLLNAAPSGDEAALGLAEALAAAELTPPLAVRRLTEEPFHGALRAWTYGKARIMGALLDWDAGEGRRITIQLEEDRYLYDVLAGDSLGERDDLRLALKPGAPSIIAALPYEVTRLVLTAGPEALKPGGRLSFAVEVKTYGGLPGEHLIRARLLQRSPLDFSGGGGDPIPHYTHFISCAGGRGKGFFPLALDESPGAYAVEVTDVLTGTQARLNVDVVPQRPETVPGD